MLNKGLDLIYYKTHKIPLWIILHECRAKHAIEEKLNEADSYNLKWPGQNFKDSVLSLKTKGWHAALSEYGKNSDGIILSPDLIVKAYADHVLSFNPKAYFSHGFPLHRINRVVKEDTDFQRIFDEVFAHSDPVTMSQNLGIGEICADTDADKRYIVVYSEGPVPLNVIKSLSDKSIHIGEGDVFDINVEGMKNKEAVKFAFNEILSTVNV